MATTALYQVPAPAKVNLFLHVLGRRNDGYHLLQSAFMLIDWCDELHFERRGDGRVSRKDLSATLPADDLCLRAARALQAASGTAYGVDISIDKRVPWGAGLGGGSSDAASTLVALNRLWQLHWPRSALLELAARLGADVPFFVGGHNAWVEGIGEVLRPIALPPVTLVVVKPAVAVPTAAIFGHPDLPRNTAPAIVADFLADPFCFGRNDLQEVARMYVESPSIMQAHGDQGEGEVGRALCLVAQCYGSSRLTGSGSAVFACAGSDAGTEGPADRLARLLAMAPQGWSGRLCQGLAEHPLRHWTRDGPAAI